MVKTISYSVYDFFIPSERNHMIPHGLSRTTFLTFLFVGFAILVSPVVTSVSRLATPVDIIGFTPNRVIELVNQARLAAGLGPLTINPLLARAAERKADDMFAKQYFAHVTPDNKQPWDFLRAENYPFFAAGENLAIDFTNPEMAHTALMNSPTHRENILNPIYNEIGVSVIPGTFKDHQRIIVVQFFAKQKPLPPPPAIVETKPVGIVAVAKPVVPTVVTTQKPAPAAPVVPASPPQKAVAGAEIVAKMPQTPTAPTPTAAIQTESNP